jgi:hypothetical protein
MVGMCYNFFVIFLVIGLLVGGLLLYVRRGRNEHVSQGSKGTGIPTYIPD